MAKLIHAQLGLLVVAVPLVDELEIRGENFESIGFFFGIFESNAVFVLPLLKGTTEEGVAIIVGRGQSQETQQKAKNDDCLGVHLPSRSCVESI